MRVDALPQWCQSAGAQRIGLSRTSRAPWIRPDDDRSLPCPFPRSFDEACLELDALAAILPMDRRDRLAEILTDDDVATLKHLAKEGMGENSLRALASDLAYLEAWVLASTGTPLPWPAPEALALKFVAQHLWDPGRRDTDPSHGMPDSIAAVLRAEGLLRADGPHAPATVRRRLSSWATLHHWKGVAGPFRSPALRSAIRLAVRATARPRTRKSEKAVTADVLETLLATCASERLADARDAALLLVAFASGGRRRSEVAGLRVEQLIVEAPVPADAADPKSAALPCLSIRLGRTKTTEADADAGCFWSGVRSKCCGNGCRGRTSPRGRCSGRSINGAVWTTGR